jgi:hypothetical protein
VEWYAPFSGVWDAWYAQCICAADVANDCLVVSESDYMSCRDDVVYADECGAIAIGDDGEVV